MPDDLLTAAQAADELGVSRRTLYAYVSRGLLRSVPGPGPTRERRYPRESIDDLRRTRDGRATPERAARASLHWGLPVLDSALTLIADGALYYRGHDAVALSRTASFEQVAALLWGGSLTPEIRAPHAGAPRGEGALGERLAQTLLRLAGESLGMGGSGVDPGTAVAGRTIAALTAAAGGKGRGPIATRLARGWGTDRVEVLDAALVLCADHELNVSAFTARCVASADARLEHVLLAALCAMQGRRHGGAVSAAELLLDDVARLGARAAAERAMSLSGSLPGFGHPLYPAGDPRAREILARLGELDRGARDLVELARREIGVHPTLDLALALTARTLGLPAESGLALFVIGRCAGWIAHAHETWAEGALIRPRSRYVGAPPQASLPEHADPR